MSKMEREALNNEQGRAIYKMVNDRLDAMLIDVCKQMDADDKFDKPTEDYFAGVVCVAMIRFIGTAQGIALKGHMHPSVLEEAVQHMVAISGDAYITGVRNGIEEETKH